VRYEGIADEFAKKPHPQTSRDTVSLGRPRLFTCNGRRAPNCRDPGSLSALNRILLPRVSALWMHVIHSSDWTGWVLPCSLRRALQAGV
jgi:hypothetical protein